MATSERCELTELLADQCAHCTKKRSVEELAETELKELRAHLIEYVPGWFESQYKGQCRSCGLFFPAGAAITGQGMNGTYIAECCADDKPTPDLEHPHGYWEAGDY